MAVCAVLLAALGAFIIWRAVARPLARITRITEAVAAGDAEATVPYRERGDEVGALARSIAVFQDAMRQNEELSRTVVDDAQARAPPPGADVGRDRACSAPTSRRRCAELGRISDQMLAASAQLAAAADKAVEPHRGRRRRLRPRPPPTCATSRRPPTSLPPR